MPKVNMGINFRAFQPAPVSLKPRSSRQALLKLHPRGFQLFGQMVLELGEEFRV